MVSESVKVLLKIKSTQIFINFAGKISMMSNENQSQNGRYHTIHETQQNQILQQVSNVTQIHHQMNHGHGHHQNTHVSFILLKFFNYYSKIYATNLS